MSFLSRLFGQGSEGDKSGDIEAELARLEAEAERAAPGYVGSAHNRAGDLALRSGQLDRAVAYYGRAIDAFLLDAQREAARGVANKIVRVRPGAVRTLCTLTWLDLAARHQATALLHLRDYVEAAREAGQSARAATEIYAMARLAPDAEFGNAVADALDGLDFPARAREVRSWAETGPPESLDDAATLADACLLAAVRSADPDELLQRAVDMSAAELDPVDESPAVSASKTDRPASRPDDRHPAIEDAPAPEFQAEADVLDAEAEDLAQAGDSAAATESPSEPGRKPRRRRKKKKRNRGG